MNQQQAYPPQIHPQQGMKPPMPVAEPEPERRACGFTLMILGTISNFALCILNVLNALLIPEIMEIGDLTIMTPPLMRIGMVVSAIGFLIGAAFNILAMSKPDYLGGKPGILKIVPLWAGLVVAMIGALLCDLRTASIVMAVVVLALAFTFSYFAYLGDDDSDSCWLCFKPWIIKSQAQIMYPPQYGYPPQGYPPQQQQAYPQQGYPQQQA